MQRFLTGRRPNATGVLLNPGGPPPHLYTAHFRTHIPNTITLPQLFRQQGWFSARVGTLHHCGVPMDIGTSSLADFASFDLALHPRGRGRDREDMIVSLRPGQFSGTLSWWCDEEGRDEDHTLGIAAAEAANLAAAREHSARVAEFHRQIARYRVRP